MKHKISFKKINEFIQDYDTEKVNAIADKYNSIFGKKVKLPTQKIPYGNGFKDYTVNGAVLTLAQKNKSVEFNFTFKFAQDNVGNDGVDDDDRLHDTISNILQVYIDTRKKEITGMATELIKLGFTAAQLKQLLSAKQWTLSNPKKDVVSVKFTCTFADTSANTYRAKVDATGPSIYAKSKDNGEILNKALTDLDAKLTKNLTKDYGKDVISFVQITTPPISSSGKAYDVTETEIRIDINNGDINTVYSIMKKVISGPSIKFLYTQLQKLGFNKSQLNNLIKDKFIKVDKLTLGGKVTSHDDRAKQGGIWTLMPNKYMSGKVKYIAEFTVSIDPDSTEYKNAITGKQESISMINYRLDNLLN